MNLAELSTFLAVVEQRSLVRAAQRLNVTQSTVTARIDSLEQRLGQRLLHRHKSGTELTSAGFKLVRYAELVTQLWGQARYEIGLPQGITSVCNIGCYFDLWEGLAERFLEHVRTRCPDIAVAAWPGDQRAIDRWLDTGLVDLAFCLAPQARGALAARAVLTDELVQVAFPPRDAAYVYVDYGEQFRRDHAVAFAARQPSSITLASARWAIDHLQRHGGTGYLPRRHQRHFGPAAEIVAGAPVLNQVVYLVENTSVTGNWPWLEEAIAALAR